LEIVLFGMLPHRLSWCTCDTNPSSRETVDVASPSPETGFGACLSASSVGLWQVEPVANPCSLRKTASIRYGVWEAAQVFKSLSSSLIIILILSIVLTFKYSPKCVSSVVIAPYRFQPPRHPYHNLTRLPFSRGR